MASVCLRAVALPAATAAQTTSACASRSFLSHASAPLAPLSSRVLAASPAQHSLAPALPPSLCTPGPRHSHAGPAPLAAPRAAVSAPAEAAPASAAPASIQDPAAAAVLKRLEKVPLPWQWTPSSSASTSGPIPIHSVLFTDPQAPAGPTPATAPPAVLLLPAPSDVATVDEWASVAACLLAEQGAPSALGRLLHKGASSEALQGARVVAVDWPGFGASGSSSLLYTADLMEDFLVDYVAHLFPEAGDSGSSQPLPLVLLGGGHAATIALRAVAKGRIKPAAVGAVAPTWAGPLPIVFGKDEKMEFRYGLLRSALRAPGIGWGLYKYLTTPKMLRMQYMTHVYASPDNVSPDVVDRGVDITAREGGRFAPASFLTGLLDPVQTREEFLGLFEGAGQRGVPVGVVVPSKGPKRSKREMEALQGVSGVTGFQVCPGALLPQEEYPEDVVKALNAALAGAA